MTASIQPQEVTTGAQPHACNRTRQPQVLSDQEQLRGREGCGGVLAVTALDHRELPGWRYDCKGNYRITLDADPSAAIFGTLREWGVERSAEGRVVYEAWQRVEDRFPGVRATYGVVMPDRFHGIVYVTAAGAADLREVVATFAADVERTLGRRVWAGRWWDSICFQQGELHREINFVLSNAKRQWIKEKNPDLFKKVHGCRHWRFDGVEEKLASVGNWEFRDCELGYSAERRELWSIADGVEIVKPRKTNRLQRAFEEGREETTLGMRLRWRGAACGYEPVVPSRRIDWAALGNPFLLEDPLVVSVRISHRTPAAEFERLQNTLRLKVQRGAVLIGTWCSPQEREIRRMAVAEGGLIVELLTEGMAVDYRPDEEDRQLCEQGRLLQLSPFAPRPAGGEREEGGMTRIEWLNRAAEMMGDAEIGYVDGQARYEFLKTQANPVMKTIV